MFRHKSILLFKAQSFNFIAIQLTPISNLFSCFLLNKSEITYGKIVLTIQCLPQMLTKKLNVHSLQKIFHKIKQRLM